MLNRPSNAVTKRIFVLAGAVLAMIAMLVIASPAPNGIFAHPHDNDEAHTDIGVAADTDDHIHIHYAENGVDEVRDFDSTDPEEAGIEWNVRGVDAADFEISSNRRAHLQGVARLREPDGPGPQPEPWCR